MWKGEFEMKMSGQVLWLKFSNFQRADILKSAQRILISFMFLFTVGCGSSINNENIKKIKNGMSYNEVVNILGEPTSGKSSNTFLGLALPYIWNGGENNCINIWFDKERKVKMMQRMSYC